MIEFQNLSKKKIDKKPLVKLYNKIFLKTFDLSVVFAPPFLMSRLNFKYRNKDKPANVLSFLLEKGRKGRGEIFLNAGEKKLPYLFVHGALHLLGFDHKTARDAERMEKEEQKMLKSK